MGLHWAWGAPLGQDQVFEHMREGPRGQAGMRMEWWRHFKDRLTRVKPGTLLALLIAWLGMRW